MPKVMSSDVIRLTI